MDRTLKELQSIVGEDHATSDLEVMISYSKDQNWFYVPPRTPDYVVRPLNRENIQQIVRIASRERLPLITLGAGVNMRGMCVPRAGGIVMDLRRMNNILEINEESRYAIIEPGISMAQFSTNIDKKTQGRFRIAMPGAPASVGACSNYELIGAYCNLQFSGGNDHVLGLEVVLADGSVILTGSWGLPPLNSPGYRRPFGPDITALFTSNPGNLGIITRMCVSIYPTPEVTKFMAVGFDDPEAWTKYGYEVCNEGLPTSYYWFGWKGLAYSVARSREDIDAFKGAFGELVNWVSIEGAAWDVEARSKRLDEITKKHPYVFGGEIIDTPADVLMEYKISRDFAKWMRNGFYWALGFYHPLLKFPTYYNEGKKLWVECGLPEEEYCASGCSAGSHGNGPEAWRGQAWYTEIESFFDNNDLETHKKVANFTRLFLGKLHNIGFMGYFRPYGFAMEYTATMTSWYPVWRKLKETFDPNNVLHPGVCTVF